MDARGGGAGRRVAMRQAAGRRDDKETDYWTSVLALLGLQSRPATKGDVMTLAPRARVSHMCLMGMLVFLPGLHLLHNISTHTR